MKLFLLLCLCGSVLGYNLVNSFVGPNFFDSFDFWTGPDPTHGFVQYVDRDTAQANGYIRQGNTVYMGVDSKNNAPSGRSSVRITSKDSWKFGLFVLIMSHVPGGQCGSWPAFWTVGDNWPYNGEIDIIEGVNTNSGNPAISLRFPVDQTTLHTGPGCAMDGYRNMTGKSVGTDCNAFDNGNSGCGVQVTRDNSYGLGFNQAGGGAYAMELTPQGIRVWFFTKREMPNDLGSNGPNPEGWRIPDASFPFGSECNFTHFGPQQIVFDMTFCGDWAGNVYQYSGCPSTCENFVAYNPGAFVDHYWEIISLKVYQ